MIQELDAQWLVTQNVPMPEGVLADPDFAAAFDRVNPFRSGRPDLGSLQAAPGCMPRHLTDRGANMKHSEWQA